MDPVIGGLAVDRDRREFAGLRARGQRSLPAS
jgi:hypothetical protein